ncbi:kinase-like protein, partial [Macroventuria anomochaeta]
MTALRRPSSPRSSTSSRRPRDIFEQHLSEEIRARIESTIVGVPDNETQIRRFLPKGDLAAILSVQALRPYLRELLGESTDNLVDNALDAIVGDSTRDGSSRRALLALFLYHRRAGLLSLFRDWLLSRQDDFPSDGHLPFSQHSLEQARIPSQYHDYIKDYQNIFIPVTIKQNIYQTFKSKERLPYIGAPLAVQDGSSGTVYTRKVAPRHWEEKLDNGRYTPAETTKPTVLALKVFSGGRTGQDAQTNFEIERSMLEDLRNSNFAHRMILLDWGSFIIQDEEARVIQHCLIFECATYTLEEFLVGAQVARTPWTGSLLLAKVVDIVQALACLHDNFDTLHLDIKPDNILVFDRLRSQSDDGSLSEAKFEWKISDFGLARKRNAKERTGPLYDANRSASHSGSLLATRPAGRFQAPEVQQQGSSKASRSSDVWSMGCVILMVLGLVVDSPARVLNLLGRLRVEFQDAGGIDSLFYVTSDSIPW